MDNLVTLHSAVEVSLLEVKQHPKHDLVSPHQLKIVRALGHCPSASEPRSPWMLRFVQLLTASVEHVLPVWDEKHPDSNHPHLILEEARSAVKLEWSLDKAIQIAHRDYWKPLSKVDQQHSSVYVLYAALAALDTVITTITQPHLFFNDSSAELVSNDTPSVEEQSPASLASFAVAGGPPWSSRANNQARLLYWEWWLQQAVYAAFNTVSDK